ncbi:hypothetical protein K501DRAFT_273394 [Backusella circina FSU 941]|nr:hypothetical protein K501DRAFT_273394 [Backusella circina FSU 941]
MNYKSRSALANCVHMKESKWKPKKHNLYTTVCITNENDASQTCPFCFEKSFHPTTAIEKDGNKKKNQSCHGCDQVSALVVGLSGLGTLILGDTFPELTTDISQSYTEFQQDALSFLKRSDGRLTTDGDCFTLYPLSIQLILRENPMIVLEVVSLQIIMTMHINPFPNILNAYILLQSPYLLVLHMDLTPECTCLSYTVS